MSVNLESIVLPNHRLKTQSMLVGNWFRTHYNHAGNFIVEHPCPHCGQTAMVNFDGRTVCRGDWCIRCNKPYQINIKKSNCNSCDLRIECLLYTVVFIGP